MIQLSCTLLSAVTFISRTMDVAVFGIGVGRGGAATAMPAELKDWKESHVQKWLEENNLQQFKRWYV